MSYREEFPDYAPDTMPATPALFDDVSWRNDTCPCFASDPLGLELWVDFAKPEDREFPEVERFSLSNQEAGVERGTDVLRTDNWNDVLAFIALRAFERGL